MRLSVVVTLVDGGEVLERCLAALMTERDPPELEVIVPWDASVPEVGSLAVRFPRCRFVEMGPVVTGEPNDTAAGQHELFDRRRSAGLAAATGDVIAMLEDRGVPRPEWARTMMALHEQLPYAVIGGAIENGGDSLMQRAVYLCDFARYQRPFIAGPRPYVSDVNVAYKRRAVDQTAPLWRDRYHETTVHWALQRSGETLYLSPDPVVDQFRAARRLRVVIGERFVWGRLFAYTRAREIALPKRAGLAVLAPFLPFLFLARQARLQIVKRRSVRGWLLVAPLVFVLLAAWSVGEAVGYITARP